MRIVLLDEDDRRERCGLCSLPSLYLVVLVLTIEAPDENKSIHTEIEFPACAAHADNMSMFLDKTVTSNKKKLFLQLP